jgi:uncharacterized protein (DUF1684 family)
MRIRAFAALSLAAALAAATLAGCGGDDAADVAAKQKADAARVAYEKTIKQWHAERLERLQRPTGWLSLVGMHWIEEGATRVGTNEKFTTRLSVGPDELGTIVLKDGKVEFQPMPDAGITIDGQPAAGPVMLVSDADGTPTEVAFNNGDASFILIKRSDKYALRVRNANAATRTLFTGIDTFPIDPAFRFDAKFTAHPPGRMMGIVNILGMEEPTPNPGTLTFSKDGQQYTIEALDDTGDGKLFIVFADGTSGHESYPAARFLYTDPPGPDGTTVLDFNKAYNPPCAFTAFSTCPLPPPSNRIPMRITAGEKKPRKIDVNAPAAP